MITGHSITLALDAMGGDHAPESVIKGANEAKIRYPNLSFLIYGNESKVAPLLKQYPKLEKASQFYHTEDIVAAHEKPSIALRQGQKSSMGLALNAVKEGKAQGAVSAGNTGALMAMSRFIVKTLPEIDRPAISSLFPTVSGECVLLDLGANIECSADHLFQFAVMGDAFARAVLGLENPKIALLNVGSEEMKGSESIRSASAMLKETKLPLNFIGFVEGDDIASGVADVIVADGFSGNIALKSAEGTGKVCGQFLKHAFSSSLRTKLAYLLAKPALHSLFNKLDPRLYNGGIFLGLNGVVVKSHGGMDYLGFATALGVAYQLTSYNVVQRIMEEMHSTKTEASSAA